MAFIIKTAKGIRNHWKKSTFAAVLLAYGVNKFYEHQQIKILMKQYCEEAAKYGQTPIENLQVLKKITVILNPASNKRKSVENYEKYCAPILNLSGMCINLVQTEKEGHAKELVGSLQDADAIVVAGGDGTLSEVITGLLRRIGEHNPNPIPVGILPLGAANSVAKTLFPAANNKVSQVKSLAEASLAVVQEKMKQMDVMKIELIDEEEKKPPVYGLSGIEWGAYRDAAANSEKYWYYGPLRKYATYVFNGYKNTLNWNCSAVINYSPPCPGCTNCAIIEPKQNKRWFEKISAKPEKTHRLATNENCKTKQERQITTTDLHLLTSNVLRASNDVPQLQLQLGPDTVDYFDFVSDGWKTEKGDSRRIAETISARQIEIVPKLSNSKSDYNEERPVWFSIDKEEFEVRPVRVTLLPKAIRMYCMPEQAQS